MAGIHQFTSSKWIQSGSQADFKSGMVVSNSFDVQGTITATAFQGDGSGITGIGATFYAGSGSAISESSPRSEDHVIILGSGLALANPSHFNIETTSSGWIPNYYTFVKITDKFETLQSGSKSSYSGSNRDPSSGQDGHIENPLINDFAPGVHRYLVYAAQTGSGGRTEQVYSTAYIRGFVNEFPLIVLPSGITAGSPFTSSMVHDANTLEDIAYFTNSQDTNDDDFIRVFSASRDSSNPTVTTTQPAYSFAMSHTDSSWTGNSGFIRTASVNTDPEVLTEYGGTATALDTDLLIFSASISSYVVNNGTYTYAKDTNPRNETFTIKMVDNNENQTDGNFSVSSFTMSIFPPTTASIENLIVQFDNGAYNNNPTLVHTASLLYGFDTHTRTTKEDLPNRYTSSLVSFRVTADILEPKQSFLNENSYVPAYNHFTTIRIQSGSTNAVGDDIAFFRFSGSTEEENRYALDYDTTTITATNFGSHVYDQADGWGIFPFSVGNWYVGIPTGEEHNLNYVRHGDNNHYKASITDMGRLNVKEVEQIQISDVVVEVENTYSSSVATDSRTETVLYGYESSSIGADIGQLENYPSGALYVSSSVIRYRVRAKIVEPKGPHHEELKMVVSSSAGEYLDTYYWQTGSTTDVIKSSPAWIDDKLVMYYTSSWLEKRFAPGNHIFSASFVTQSEGLNATIAPYTVQGMQVVVNNTAPTEINNIVYETETYGKSGTPTTYSERKVLYGIPHHTITTTSSFHGHPSSSTYESQSLSRFRVRARITEPVGPHHTASLFEKVFSDGIVGGEASTYYYGDVESIWDDNLGTSTNQYRTDGMGSDNDVDGWLRIVDTGESGNTGPSAALSASQTSSNTEAATTGTTYMMCETSNPDNDSTFVMRTPQINVTGTTDEKLILYYHAYGSSIGTFKIYYGTAESGDVIDDGATVQLTNLYNTGSATAVNQISGQQQSTETTDWHRLEVDISSLRGLGNRYIYFEYIGGGTSHTGDFSIDNVYIIGTSGGGSSETITDTIIFSSASADVEVSNSYYDTSDRFVSDYTSSWIAQQLSASIEGDNSETTWSYSSGSILHNSIGSYTANTFTTASGQTSSLLIYDTIATSMSEFVVEIEEYGHSASDAFDSGLTAYSNMSERTVLYGQPHTTTADSSSFQGHPSESLYASHSVTRFRIRGKIVEPVGPLHHSSSVARYFIDVENSRAVYSANLTFATNSQNIVSNSYYDTQDRFVNEYTSSWYGANLLSDTNDGVATWMATTNTTHSTIGENDHTPDSPSIAFCKVFSTEQTQIVDLVTEIEEYGHSASDATDSGVSGQQYRTVLYGQPHTTTADSSSFVGHASESLYASHSVTRFRVRAKVIEPMGPLHSSTLVTKNFESSDFTNYDEDLTFATNSVHVSNSYYDSSNRLVTTYTSSWSGSALRVDSADNTTWTISASAVHNPSDENGYSLVGGETSTIVAVEDTARTLIENIKIETETIGMSGIGVQDTDSSSPFVVSRSLLYGEDTTRADDSGLDGQLGIYSASAVTRFRILADITEPVGPLHHPVDLRYEEEPGGTSNGQRGAWRYFSTASATVETSQSYWDNQSRLVGNYTSSWIGESFSPSSNGYWRLRLDVGANNSLAHFPTGENEHSLYNSSADSLLYLAISASKDIEVESRVEVENEYSSSIGASSRTQNILYGYTRTLSASDADTIGDIWSGSAAVRTRVLAKITEPLGLGHFKTQVSMSSNAQDKVRGFEFHTGSQETASSTTRALNSDNLYVTAYTSSWEDGFTFEQQGGAITFSPTTKTGSNTTGTYISSDGITDTSTTDASLTINDAPATEIKNIRVEVEATNSGSGQGTSTRTTTILHGNTVTEDDKIVNIGYPTTDARNQLTSVRLLADIEEPFGPHHTSSKFTISGYNSSHIVTLHTGSTEAELSSLSYTTHGSQSVSYTSSFVPIENSQGSKTIENSSVVHMFEDSKTTTNASPAAATITVNPVLSASVFVAPTTTSADFIWSQSADLVNYVSYDEHMETNNTDIVVKIASGISASAPLITSESALVFPTHLNTYYVESTGNPSGITVSPSNGNSTSEDTASITIDEDYMDDWTDVKKFDVLVSGSDILAGNGTSSVSTFPFHVVPSKPQSMHDKYWTSDGAPYETTDNSGREDGRSPQNHRIVSSYGSTGIYIPGPPNSNNGKKRIYAATLPPGFGTYKSGDEAGTLVRNVVMAKDDRFGPVTYTMSFTPAGDQFTGNYTDTDRAFNYGDSGSLIVKINDSEVVNYSLQDNFVKTSKSGSQPLAEWPGNGTASFGGDYSNKGRLIITDIAPFNNVSQSIYSDNKYWPNGYQAWSAKIQIDDKLRDGYNKLEFSHSIDATTTQSWKSFDWYYDDGITEPTLSMQGTPTMSYRAHLNEPTFSLSGVNWFTAMHDNNSTIYVSFMNRIFNIAHKTYIYSDNNSWQSGLVGEGDYALHSKGGNTAMELQETNASGIEWKSNTDGVKHWLYTGGEPTLVYGNGLIFDNDETIIHPSSSHTASIKDLRIKVNPGFNNYNDKGSSMTVNMRMEYRNWDNHEAFNPQIVSDHYNYGTEQIPFGRFLDTASIDIKYSTDQVEHFFAENYRWKSSSLTDTQLDDLNMTLPGNSYQYYLSNADYNSVTNISESNDLQVDWSGQLVYPSKSYVDYNHEAGYLVTNPGYIDYSGPVSSSGERTFTRAFYVGTTNTSEHTFYIRVFTPTEDYNDTIIPHRDYGIRYPIAGTYNPTDYDDLRLTSTDASSVTAGQRNVRIECKLPGPVPVDSAGFDEANAHGSIWYNAGKQRSGGTTEWGTNQAEYKGAFDGVTGYTWNSNIGCHQIKINMGAYWGAPINDGVVICRVIMKGLNDGYKRDGTTDSSWGVSGSRYITSMSFHYDEGSFP